MNYPKTANEVAACRGGYALNEGFETREVSPIEHALARLANELDVVDGRVHDLQGKLKPVTAPVNIKGGISGANPQPPAASEVEGKLEALIGRAQQVSDRLQALTEALRV